MSLASERPIKYSAQYILDFDLLILFFSWTSSISVFDAFANDASFRLHVFDKQRMADYIVISALTFRSDATALT